MLLAQGFGSGWVSSPCGPSDFGSILCSGSFQRKLFPTARMVRPGPFLTVSPAPSALCCYRGSNARGMVGTPVPGLLSVLKGLWFSESPRERPGSFPPAVPLPLSPSAPKQLCPAAPLPLCPLPHCLPVPLPLCPSTPLLLCPSTPLLLCPSTPLPLCPSVTLPPVPLSLVPLLLCSPVPLPSVPLSLHPPVPLPPVPVSLCPSAPRPSAPRPSVPLSRLSSCPVPPASPTPAKLYPCFSITRSLGSCAAQWSLQDHVAP